MTAPGIETRVEILEMALLKLIEDHQGMEDQIRRREGARALARILLLPALVLHVTIICIIIWKGC